MFGRDNLFKIEKALYKLNGKELRKVSYIIDDIFKENIRKRLVKNKENIGKTPT